MARQKTRLMRQVEERYGQPLERLLPQLYNEMGLPGMAQELGISKGTLWYWLLKYGVSVHRVALAPGESLEIRRNA
ncbi:MAG: hypothetical protein HY688_02685 [Chloroflexi bacterium]|nr:hypothetical protein [Chloroflexota bacterium]